MRFKHTASRISRFWYIFEPRHICAAFWANWKTPKGRSDVLGVDFATRSQRRGDGGGFVAELGLFRRQRRLVDRSREVRGQEAIPSPDSRKG